MTDLLELEKKNRIAESAMHLMEKTQEKEKLKKDVYPV